jgi:hypothetical protein
VTEREEERERNSAYTNAKILAVPQLTISVLITLGDFPTRNIFVVLFFPLNIGKVYVSWRSEQCGMIRKYEKRNKKEIV